MIEGAKFDYDFRPAFLIGYVVCSSRVLRPAGKVSERLEKNEARGGAYLNNSLKAVEPNNITSSLKSLIK